MHDANCNVFAGRAAVLLSNLSQKREGEYGGSYEERQSGMEENEEKQLK